MNSFTGLILPEGALIEVSIGLIRADAQAQRTAGKPVPNPASFQALLDPGAEVICVDPSALARLIPTGIQPLRFVFTNMPAASGHGLGAEYSVSLTVLHPSGNARAHLTLPNQPVIEQPLAALGYQVLLGRDLLQRCLLFLDGPGKQFTIAY
jgi:hypothetical protein